MTKLEVGESRELDEKEYDRLLRREPDSLRFAEFADQLRRRGNLTQATAVCARGLLRHPHYATGHVVMGEVFRDEKLLDKAEEAWREALRLDPFHPRAHMRMAELYLERGQVDRAVAALEASLISSPESPEAQKLLLVARSGGKALEVKEQAAEGLESERRPAVRPSWLTADRFDDLVDAVAECSSVEGAILANVDGLLLAGNIPACSDQAAATAMAVELVREANELIAPLGGKLQAALIRGEKGSVRCVTLEGLTLVAVLKPDLPVGAADAEIEDAIAGLREQETREEQFDGR